LNSSPYTARGIAANRGIRALYWRRGRADFRTSRVQQDHSARRHSLSVPAWNFLAVIPLTSAPRFGGARHQGGNTVSLGTIILVILVIALLGGFSGIGGGPFYGTGYYGGGGLGLVIVILLILVLMGRL
jgi:hypothetical protein